MTNTFWEWLLEKDRSLFELINTKWTHAILDAIMPWARTSNNWYPFYIVLLGFLFFKWGKKAWKWVLLVAVNVALTDQISSGIFKPLVHRLRPCADPTMIHHSKLLLEHCSGGFSFTSSHAANHFGLAMFVCMTLEPLFKKSRYWFFLWAAWISYAQVYVGVHYPLDVFCGALIGCLVGFAMGKVFQKWQIQ